MHDKVKEALASLKDFQKKTVEYVFDRMYNNGQNKMLVADEVGLGKTIIAKGVIAKAYQKFLDTHSAKRQFRVVYICSNQALASQNIRKLNFFGDTSLLEQDINRLTYLSYKDTKHKGANFKISALTPGTSFNNKSRFGEANERAIIYALLAHYQPFYDRRNGLKWLLIGSKEINRWNNQIESFYKNREVWLRKDIFRDFRSELMGYCLSREKEPRLFEHFGRKNDISLWHGLHHICDDLSGRNIHIFDHAAELVSTLRRLLAKICIPYLDADIFVLDEFQRYNQLIKWEQEEQSPAVEMAKAVFSIPGARILMLSATPFKAYTDEFDELNGEVHYTEFRSVLQFLLQGKEPAFWKAYEEERRAFSRLLQDAENWGGNREKIRQLKKKLEDLYTTAMVRTERLLVSTDGNALVKDVLKNKYLPLTAEDIQDFVNLDAISKKLDELTGRKLPIPVEYVKSTPFALSFLQGYQLKKRLGEEIEKIADLKKMVLKNSDLFVSRKAIKEYKTIISLKASKLPNAKLRGILENNEDGWSLLWVPPTLPYYELQGVFKSTDFFTKTLLFSNWVMVPKMIASIMSYEAERRTIGRLPTGPEEEVDYFKRARTPKQQFTFKTINREGAKQEAKQLSNFVLLYPCLSLATLYDPKSNLENKLSLPQLKKELTKKIGTVLEKLNIRKYGKGGGEMDKWFWAAPILMDRLGAETNPMIADWFASTKAHTLEVSVNAEDEDERDKAEHQGRELHFEIIHRFFHDEVISLPKLTDEKYKELIEHLAEMTLASPAICIYRTLIQYFKEPSRTLDAAYHIALSFLSLFNRPESIAVIRLSIDNGPYWQRVLQYCIHGSFQAMLDEFVYLLYDCEGIKEVLDIQDYITDILTLKTSTIDIDHRDSFLNAEGARKLSIRTHYAMDFGLQKRAVTHGTNREVNLRQTFNSPFRPFVLATTSIGQEGLDFHLYCKKIIHWNLPHNAIDLEQREGRINRYKGLVIRQNLAKEFKDKLLGVSHGILWDHLFALAGAYREKARVPCDLIPFWHFEPSAGFHSQIERYVPLYPFSRDIEKYNDIRRILTYYRLTFGQPRQEDLIQTFNEEIKKEDLEELLINLCPLLL
jgi:hypothetical protein